MKKVLFLFTVVTFVLIAAVLVLRHIDDYAHFWRMRETPQIRPHEEPLLVMQDGPVPKADGEAFLRLTKGEDLRSPVLMTKPKVVEAGKTQYFLFCAQCHGRNHDGNAPVGQSFYPLPTDLRSARVQSLPEGVIFKVISYGLPDPEAKQPPLHSTITVIDRWRIVAYVKSLGVRR